MIRGGLVTLAVSDVDAAVRFYVETLGMKLVGQAVGRAVVDAGGGFSIGLCARRVEVRGVADVELYAKVPLREAVAILENRGVAFEVTDDDRGACARFRDPDGNVLCLRQAP